MATTPVIDFRDPVSNSVALSSVTLTGSGASNAIPAGQTSNTYTLRIYNNFSAAGSIADAVNCVLAAYDNASIDGSMSSVPVINTWLQVRVLDYNGATTGQDGQFYAIGGTQKHNVPVNNGVLAGSGANYFSVSIQAVIPAQAVGSNVTQGLWLECNYNL